MRFTKKIPALKNWNLTSTFSVCISNFGLDQCFITQFLHTFGIIRCPAIFPQGSWIHNKVFLNSVLNIWLEKKIHTRSIFITLISTIESTFFSLPVQVRKIIHILGCIIFALSQVSLGFQHIPIYTFSIKATSQSFEIPLVYARYQISAHRRGRLKRLLCRCVCLASKLCKIQCSCTCTYANASLFAIQLHKLFHVKE